MNVSSRTCTYERMYAYVHKYSKTGYPVVVIRSNLIRTYVYVICMRSSQIAASLLWPKNVGKKNQRTADVKSFDYYELLDNDTPNK